MNGLDRHILREIAIPSTMALFVVSFFAIGNEIRQQIEEVIAFIRFGDIVILAVLFFPLLLSYVIPITFLLGILMAFGQLAKHGEITALRAGGISLKRTIAPVVAAGALLSGMCFLVQDSVQPWAIKKAFALVYSEVPQRATLDVLHAGVMHEYEGWRVYFEQKDSRTGTLYNIDLVKPDPERGVTVFYAQSAKLEHVDGDYQLVLTDGHLVTPDNLRLGFEREILTVPGPSPTETMQVRKAKSLAELFKSQDTLLTAYTKRPTEWGGVMLSKERGEIAKRLSLPFAAVAFSLVAAPLGARSKRGGRSYAFAVGFTVLLIYVILMVVSEPQSMAPLSEFILRAWVPNLLLVGIGAALILKVDRV